MGLVLDRDSSGSPYGPRLIKASISGGARCDADQRSRLALTDGIVTDRVFGIASQTDRGGDMIAKTVQGWRWRVAWAYHEPRPPVTLFDRYIAVDWSANNTPKSGRDSIWAGVGIADADSVETTNLKPAAARKLGSFGG
jgi:hypothetical protein